MSRSGRQQPARRIVRPGKAAEWSLGAAGRILQREERIEADWRTRGSCTMHDPDLWFSAAEADVEFSKSVCADCPVQQRCADFALKIGARDGTWGGLDEEELRAGKRLRIVPPPPPKPRYVPPTLPELKAHEVARFHSKAVPGGCGLTWESLTRRDGFGVFRVTRDGVQRPYRAHRIAYMLATGTDPGADTVIQACGDRACVTPGCLQIEPVSETRRRTAQRRTAA